jgi:hypothetical protein
MVLSYVKGPVPDCLDFPLLSEVIFRVGTDARMLDPLTFFFFPDDADLQR